MIDLNEEQAERAQRRAVPAQSDFPEVTLPPLPAVPSMISPGEARYLYWLTSRGHTGAGAVVEVGTWLGSSTLHLAAGLRDSGYATQLHCFDNFKWAGTGDNEKSGLNLIAGADFQPYFEKNIAPFRDKITVTRADFSEIRWPKDKPIDILFLDGPKNAAHLSQCLLAFREALVPGLTIVVFQDYQHPTSFDVPLAVQTLGDALTRMHAIASGGTVSYLLTRALTAEDAAASRLDWQSKSPAELQTLWHELLSSFESPVVDRLRSAYALHLWQLGEHEAAKQALRAVKFDSRLHAGWKRWSTQPPMIKRYKPLFDLYTAELAK